MLRFDMLCYVMVYYVTLGYGMLCYDVTLRFIVLLYYVIMMLNLFLKHSFEYCIVCILYLLLWKLLLKPDFLWIEF